MFNLNDLWLGDANSLRGAAALEARALSSTVSGDQRAGEEKVPRLYSRIGNVGVITIRGSLINAENFFTELFGMSTYPAIRAALVFAAQDAGVDEILMDIESPGGAVSGVNDTASLVRAVRAFKPVTTFSGDLLASAAYWVGSAANKIFVGETAIVGSIGIIATMVSEHDALKKEGIDVRVIRAGKNKALGHAAEPITDKATAQIQARVDAMYDVFTAAVTKNRPGLKADKSGVWAEGNEFLGEEAVSSGLADQISSFDKVLAQLTVDKSKTPNNNANQIQRGTLMKPRAALDPKLVALIAAGVTLTAEQQAEADAVTKAAAAEAATEVAAAAAVAATEAAKLAADKAVADAAKLAADTAAAATAASGAGAKSEIVAYLESQVAEKTAEVAALKDAEKALKAEVAAIKAPHEALLAIAANSVNTMAVALGGSKLDLAALSATEVLAKHAATLADFTKAFPVGGVAATALEKTTIPSNVTQIDQARLSAARLTNEGGK